MTNEKDAPIADANNGEHDYEFSEYLLMLLGHDDFGNPLPIPQRPRRSIHVEKDRP